MSKGRHIPHPYNWVGIWRIQLIRLCQIHGRQTRWVCRGRAWAVGFCPYALSCGIFASSCEHRPHLLAWSFCLSKSKWKSGLDQQEARKIIQRQPKLFFKKKKKRPSKDYLKGSQLCKKKKCIRNMKQAGWIAFMMEICFTFFLHKKLLENHKTNTMITILRESSHFLTLCWWCYCWWRCRQF